MWFPFRAALIAASLCTSVSLALTAESASAPPPDLNGVWVNEGGFLDKADPGFTATLGRQTEQDIADFAALQERSLPPYKEAYLKAVLDYMKAESEGRPINDPGARCIPPGLPRFWGPGYAFEIMQTPNQINFFQETLQQTHRVYLDGRPHPAELDPSFNGHSIGHWEGKVLVVDTVGISQEAVLAAGGPHTDALRVTQRIRLTSPDRLLITVTSVDSEVLTKPWVTEVALVRKKDLEIAEYVCEQNNRTKVDANGASQTILRQ